MTHRERPFVPAAGHDLLLPLYDPLTRLLGAERARDRLLERVPIGPGERVLDLGVGTGALAIALARRHPAVTVVGVDPDPHALARARAKAARAGVALELHEAFGDSLPFADGSFDRVVSSLVLHHLDRPAKQRTLREVARVLGRAGTLHVLDFGPPRGRIQRLLAGVFHRDATLRDNVEGRIPGLMTDAGLADAREAASWSTAFGAVSLFEARRA